MTFYEESDHGQSPDEVAVLINSQSSKESEICDHVQVLIVGILPCFQAKMMIIKDPIKIEEEEELEKEADQEIYVAVHRPVDCTQRAVDKACRQHSTEKETNSDFQKARSLSTWACR